MGQRQTQVYMGVTMLTESRRRTCGSSEAQEDLACQPVKDGGDTCRGRGRVWSTLLASGFDGLGLKTIDGGFTGLGIKTQEEVSRRNRRHVAASWSSRRGEATAEEARWPSDEEDTRLDLYVLGLNGLTHLYTGAKLKMCNSPVK
jgi:hypothetical protein